MMLQHMTIRFIMISFLLFGVSFSQQHGDLEVDKEVNQIIQIALDLPDLQQYFHIDTDSTRAPLKIKLPKELHSLKLKDVHKFNLPVTSYDKDSNCPYFEILNFIVSSTTVQFNARYEAEGLTIKYHFEKRNGSWDVTSFNLAETK